MKDIERRLRDLEQAATNRWVGDRGKVNPDVVIEGTLDAALARNGQSTMTRETIGTVVDVYDSGFISQLDSPIPANTKIRAVRVGSQYRILNAACWEDED